MRVPYANGSAFATQFLYREFRARGHRVTVVGPSDPHARPDELPAHHVTLDSLPLRVHPGVRLALPSAAGLSALMAQRFDLVLGQTATELAQVGVFLRATQGVPFLCVNTIHLPSVYNTLLPDRWLGEGSAVNALFRDRLIPFIERHSARIYNQTDGLVVLSRGLSQYWRARGVTAPIYVIPRSVEPKIFDRTPTHDPFPPLAPRGFRLLCVCRHIREKALDRLIALFARDVAPRSREATLTLVGDGPDQDALRQHAARLGVSHRVFFTGDVPSVELPAYYRHADLFVYTSLSETYGQVVSEALWSGLPVVAFADGMGVSDQVEHGRTGLLVIPGPDRERADRALGAEMVGLLKDPSRRRALSREARRVTRERVHPDRILDLHYAAFESARRHCLQTRGPVPDASAQARSIAGWAAVHGALAMLGCLRPQTTVHHGAGRRFSWNALEHAPFAVPAPHAQVRRPGPASELACPAG